MLLSDQDLSTTSTFELEQLADAIEAELTWRALGEAPAAAGREVVEVWPAARGCFRLEQVRCGKPTCRCTAGKKHGPYWYLYRRNADGRLTSTYIGKSLSTRAAIKELEIGERGGQP